MSSVISAAARYARREPVRVATMAVTVAIVVISMFADTPVAAIVAQIAGAAAVLERVRKSVAPMVNVIVHADELEPADLSDAPASEEDTTPDVAPEPAPEAPAEDAAPGEPLSEEDAAAILDDAAPQEG